MSYDSIKQRARFFKEINGGEIAIKEETGDWKKYDSLNTGYVSERYINEYCDMIAKNNVQFNDIALVEFIIDRLKPNKLVLKLNIDSTPTNIYLANNNSPSTKYTISRNNAAFEVSKAVYDLFNEDVGENFTSEATGVQVLEYAGKVSNSALGGTTYSLVQLLQQLMRERVYSPKHLPAQRYPT